MVFNSVLNNFTSGEWSPKMLARTDTEQYPRAAREITNGFVRPQGGVFKRPAFAHRSKFAFDLSQDHIVIPYLFRGTRYAIFATDGGWYAVNVDTWVSINVTPAFDVSLPVSARSIRHVQLGETLFLVRDDGRPLTLKYSFNTLALNVENYDNGLSSLLGGAGDEWKSFPYGPVNANGIGGTLTVTGTLTAGRTVTLSSTLPIFNAAHAQTGAGEPNLLIKITSAGNTAVIQVTTVTNQTTAAGVMLSAKSGTSPLAVGTAAGTAYELSAWNGFDGYPTTITAIQNRLVFGRGSTLYFTRAGNYYDLMEIPFQQASTYTSYASDGSRPFTAAPFSTGITNILELTSSKTLIILTENSEIVGYGGANGISALPGGFIVESSSSFGTKRVPPVRVNNFVTFVQAIGKTVRDLTFNWEISQYKSMDMSFPAEHMLRSTTVRTMDTSEMDGSHLWVLQEDGTLIQCSLDRDYSITAWTRVTLKGHKFRSIGVVKAIGQHYDDAFIATVEDTASGVVQIVRLASSYEEPEIDPMGPFPEYMDLFQYFTHVSPTKIITGLSLYEGKEVQVIADGFYMGKFTVTGGEITVPMAHSLALVGLPLEFRLESMPVEAGARLGDSTGKNKRLDTAFIRFFNTLGARYGCPQTGEYYDIPFREDSQPMNEPSKMRDLDVELSFPGTYSKVATVAVESDYPFPCNVLGVGVQGLTNE